MVKIKCLSVFLIFFAVVSSSCRRNAPDTTDWDEKISEFIKKNNIKAVKDESGLYYEIINPGSGEFKYPVNTQITIKYEGKLLNGDVFDNGGGEEQTFNLADLIQGWRKGIPKIQKGGEVRLIIPPSLGYGENASGAVPANSVLDFTIQLINTK